MPVTVTQAEVLDFHSPTRGNHKPSGTAGSGTRSWDPAAGPASECAEPAAKGNGDRSFQTECQTWREGPQSLPTPRRPQPAARPGRCRTQTSDTQRKLWRKGPRAKGERNHTWKQVPTVAVGVAASEGRLSRTALYNLGPSSRPHASFSFPWRSNSPTMTFIHPFQASSSVAFRISARSCGGWCSRLCTNPRTPSPAPEEPPGPLASPAPRGPVQHPGRGETRRARATPVLRPPRFAAPLEHNTCAMTPGFPDPQSVLREGLQSQGSRGRPGGPHRAR